MLKVQEIREIIKLIDDSSINEFSYETNDSKLKLKKEKGITQATEQPISVQEPVLQAETNDVKLPKQEVESVKMDSTEPEDEEEQNQATVDFNHEIVSPMVGTFYQSPSPDSDPYVTINSEVEPESVVCIVEAMKLFNEIEAEVSGTIVEVLVEDGELVEYGQPLFRVK